MAFRQTFLNTENQCTDSRVLRKAWLWQALPSLFNSVDLFPPECEQSARTGPVNFFYVLAAWIRESDYRYSNAVSPSLSQRLLGCSQDLIEIVSTRLGVRILIY
jgi:hypothetical protein